MAEGNPSSNTDANVDEENYTPSASKRKVYKYPDTPITYKDVDVSSIFLIILNS